MFATAISFLAVWATVHAAPSSKSAPTAKVLNGTYVGTRSASYDQDFFLGMPYAQQPVGNLRFTVPQSLNESWSGTHDAKEYSDICVGYGVSTVWLRIAVSSSLHCICRPTRSGIPSPRLVLLSMSSGARL